MPAYLYRVSDTQGREESGVIEAANPVAARAILRDRGQMVLAIEQGKGAAHRVISLRRLALVTRQLATLLGSRLRIEQAFSTIANSHPPRIAARLTALRAALTEGRGLAEAMADYPRDFPELYRATIRAGEAAGRLDSVLEHLANHLELMSGTRQTVILALLYPALLTVVSLMIVSGLMIFVIPDIVAVFAARGSELPLLTRTMIALSAVIREWGAVIALALLGSAGLARLWLANPANRRSLDRLLVEAAPTRGIVKGLAARQFAATLSMLVQSGVPLVAALTAAGEALSNHDLRARVAEIARKVSQGERLHRAMEEADCFPAMLLAMVASGEANARLAEALDRAATEQGRLLDTRVKAAVGLVEPAILLVMGGFVLTIVLAILLPIVSMNDLVGL